MTYTIISPARDDAAGLERVARSIFSQTHQPLEWIIVENGSSDATYTVAESLSAVSPLVAVLSMQGNSLLERGGGVVRALSRGLDAMSVVPDVVVKLDADVSFGEDHFAGLIARFADPLLGIASGVRFEQRRGGWRRQRITSTTVEAQCRAYRRECLSQIMPLPSRLGWDGIDVARARNLGWRTRTFEDVQFRHHRAIRSRERSQTRAWARDGAAAYHMGYRGYYVLLRALFKGATDPSALGLLAGYVGAALRRDIRAEAATRAFFRREQSLRNLAARVGEAVGFRVDESRTQHKRVDVLLVGQPGGHLLELVSLRDLWESRSRAWVTLRSRDSESLLSGENVLFGHGPTPRSIKALVRNCGMAVRVLQSLRPHVILTTGAALAVPYAWIGRLFGARTVYIECAGRVDSVSLSFRIVACVADRLFVQWPDLAGIRGAEYFGRIRLALPAHLRTKALSADGGTLVTVGTGAIPFERLFGLVGDARLDGPVVVQHGPSNVSFSAERCVAFMDFDELLREMCAARTIVTHAGVGSVALANAAGHRPILIPRRKALGEHVDDHQVAFAARMAEAGSAVVVGNAKELRVLAREGTRRATAEMGSSALMREVTAYVDERSLGSASFDATVG